MTTTKPEGYPATPTLDKMSEVTDDSHTIGEFLDWLSSDAGGHLFVARWEHQRECGNVERKGGWMTYDIARCRDGIMVATDEHPTEEEGFEIDECTACGGTGLVDRIEPVAVHNSESIEQLLARYFGIDLAAADRERNAVLAYVQEQQP